jgi:hypothetical protein
MLHIVSMCINHSFYRINRKSNFKTCTLFTLQSVCLNKTAQRASSLTKTNLKKCSLNKLFEKINASMPPARKKTRSSSTADEANQERKIQRRDDRLQDELEFEVEKILNFGQSKDDPNVSQVSLLY